MFNEASTITTRNKMRQHIVTFIENKEETLS